LGSARVKAARKTLVKLTPGRLTPIYVRQWSNDGPAYVRNYVLVSHAKQLEEMMMMVS